MNNSHLSLLSLIVLIMISIFITSCEKETFDSEEASSLETLNEEEQGAVEELDVRLALQMTFDKDEKPEVIEAKWKEAVNRHLMTNQSNRTTTSWAFILRTVTGDGPIDGTNGTVRSTVVFNTNTIRSTARNIPLISPSAGSVILNFFEVINADPRTTVSLRKTSVQLQGTDGWQVDRFDVYMPNWLQPDSDSGAAPIGASAIYRDPEVFLDNNNPNSFDTYNSGVQSNSGTITWP